MLGRFFRLIWGDDVERALKPLLITGNYDVLWIGVTALETLLAWADPLAGRLRAARAA